MFDSIHLRVIVVTDLHYDGIHIATAREANCDMIISADKELDKQNIVKRVDPLDYKISHTKETSNTK